MDGDSALPLKTWIKNLPASPMVYPESLLHQVKYLFWRVYTPYHSFFRDTLLTLGILRHHGRQHFLLGTVAPHLSLQEFIAYLVAQGYGNHFVAWKDEGEIVSLRYVKDFVYQYHLRVFEDGEVRGHYEYTPECYPILHMKEVDMRDCRSEFLRLLQDKIIPTNRELHVEPIKS